MRNNEEFKSLVYAKRDRLLAEELPRQKAKLNKRLWGFVSSAAAACLIAALVLPNIDLILNGFTINEDVNVQEEHPPENTQRGEAPGEENNGPSAPFPEDVLDGDCTSAELSPPKDTPDIENESVTVQSAVRFTQILSTEPSSSLAVTGKDIGNLIGSLDSNYVIIKDYDTLRAIFERLCDNITYEDAFGSDLFSNGVFIVAILREDQSLQNTEVIYSSPSCKEGVLSLERKYTYNQEEALPAVTADCVDFAVIYAPFIDPDSITSLDVSIAN